MFIAVEEQASQVPMTLSSDEAKKVIAKARDMARAPRARGDETWQVQKPGISAPTCVCVFFYF